MVPQKAEWTRLRMTQVQRKLSIALFIAAALPIAACAQDVETGGKRGANGTSAASPQVKSAQSTSATPRPGADPDKFALIICGIGGEPAYTKQFSTWASTLRTALVDKMSFPAGQTTLLVEKPEDEIERAATIEEVRRSFASVKAAANKGSSVFIFLIGHGSFNDKEAKFNLVGPDLTPRELALLVKGVPAKRVVVVNMASASGEFLKPLSAAGTIVITATRSGGEQNATRFPEYFVDALSKSEADADKNGRVSVGEAFNYATRMTSAFYQEQGRLATEHSLLDDNGDGVGHQTAEAGDGGLATTTYFDSFEKIQAGGDAELAKLLADRARLESEIEQLKAKSARKEKTDEAYEAELEKLLIDLATVSQKIRSKQK